MTAKATIYVTTKATAASALRVGQRAHVVGVDRIFAKQRAVGLRMLLQAAQQHRSAARADRVVLLRHAAQRLQLRLQLLCL